MKTIQKRWLPLFLLAAVTFLFPACEGNNPDENLEGVVTIKMRNESNGNTWINYPGIALSCVHISDANNFAVYLGDQGQLNAGITDVGMKKLSQVTTLPSTGWVQEIAVQISHSYIYRIENYHSENHYLKIYVKDWIKSTSGGIIGAEVQYCEWTPEQ